MPGAVTTRRCRERRDPLDYSGNRAAVHHAHTGRRRRRRHADLGSPDLPTPTVPADIDGFQGDDVALFFNLARSTLGRWTVDLAGGSVKSEMLDDQPCELPKVDERFYGHGQRWGYLIGGDAKGTGMRMHSLVVRDRTTGDEQRYRLRQRTPVAGDGADLCAAHSRRAGRRRLPDGSDLALDREPRRIRHFRHRRHLRGTSLPNRDTIPARLHPARTLEDFR